ncbi:MAG: peptide deformylase [Chloroflexi bacterium]|nr:peptide deformylase [Chloroflexota bacterium]
MPVREIITPQNPVLRKKAHKITKFDDSKLQTLIEDMIETLLDAPGVGLAAPQVAASQRVIVVRLPDDEQSKEEYGTDAGVLHVVINPEIIRASREMVDGIEACLSIPGYFGSVDRHVAVTVRGQDRQGKMVRIKARDWLARVFQHEIDHLDGVLFIDRATELWRATKRRDGDGAAPAEPDPLEGILRSVEEVEEIDEEDVIEEVSEETPGSANPAP